jgi:hypothetical protein
MEALGGVHEAIDAAGTAHRCTRQSQALQQLPESFVFVFGLFFFFFVCGRCLLHAKHFADRKKKGVHFGTLMKGHRREWITFPGGPNVVEAARRQPINHQSKD